MICASAFDGGLSVVGLHEPVLALHDTAIRIGEVLLGFGIGLGRGRGSFRSGFLAPLGFTLLCRLGLCFELGCGRRLRLRLQVGLGGADPLGTPLLIGDPLRHLLAGLIAAVQLVLLGVRRLGRAEPLGDLGFQLGGAIVHALVAHRLVLRRVGLDLGAIERDMPELHQAGLLAQLQNLREQFAKRLQVPLAKIRDGAEIRRIERHNAHEVDPFPARLGDPARRVAAATVRIEQQRRHHDGIERRLPPLAAVRAGDLGQVDFIPYQAQHKTGEMVLGHEVLHHRWQKQRLIDLPGAKCLAHAHRQNLTRPSCTSKIRLLLGQAPSGRF